MSFKLVLLCCFIVLFSYLSQCVEIKVEGDNQIKAQIPNFDRRVFADNGTAPDDGGSDSGDGDPSNQLFLFLIFLN